VGCGAGARLGRVFFRWIFQLQLKFGAGMIAEIAPLRPRKLQQCNEARFSGAVQWVRLLANARNTRTDMSN
jgi:hypothetical protein